MRSGRTSAFVVPAGTVLLALPAFGAEEGAIGSGSRLKSGSKVTATIGNVVRLADDRDDFVFEGYAGQTVSITVAAGSKSGLLPFVYLHRPDGSLVGAADGAKFTGPPVPSAKPFRTAKVKFRLDVTGVWTLRVVGGYPSVEVSDDPATPDVDEGDDPATPDVVEDSHLGFDYDSGRTTGDYTVSLKATAIPGTSGKDLAADGNGQYRFLVPGVGGGTFNATLKWKGAPITFFSFKSPDGRDVPGLVVSPKGTSLVIKGHRFAADAPLGNYVLTYQAHPTTPSTKVSFNASVAPAKGDKPLKGRFQVEEPLVTSLSRTEGGGGSDLTVTCLRLVDENRETGVPRAWIGRFPLEDVTSPSPTTLRGIVPAGLPEGTFDVVVESSSGQAAVVAKAFRRVPPPDARTLEPRVGSSAGGYDVTITGVGFNPSTTGNTISFVSLVDSFVVTPTVAFSAATDTRLVFRMPAGANALTPGPYRVRVTDSRTGLSDTMPHVLELTTSAAIQRCVPGLVPTLGDETMFVQGANFKDTDVVELEDAIGSGTYSDRATTFLSDRTLQFTAPPRSKGVYRVRVRDAIGFRTPTRSFAYYAFADLTPTLGIGGAADEYDATSTFLADYDRDGDDDLFLSRALSGAAGATRMTTPQTRVLRNDGAGGLTDVTASVMPAVKSDDDWRADRVWAADVTLDGASAYPDLLLCTNSATFPAAGKSHVRILVNEPRNTTDPTDRVFRDRTLELFAPPRQMAKLFSGTPPPPDDWRALDMWVGDLDLSAANPPEIVITHDELKEELDVTCTPYCFTPYSSFVSYAFYWGGSRAFVWDPTARGGLGRYKFDHNFFPRKSGVTVPIANPPPGVKIPACTGGSCRGKFTPFTGQRLAVGRLDLDGKPDIAVLASTTPLPGSPNPAVSLQVALTKFDPVNGVNVTDLTAEVGQLGGVLSGHSVTIGSPGFPDGSANGVIAFARQSAPASGSALRLLRWKESAVGNGTFEDVTSKVLPNPLPPLDALQASALRFLDVDEDGDEDLVLVASSPPSGSENAFRILRNEADVVDGVPSVGVLRLTLDGLVDEVVAAHPQGDPYDGVCLAIGDVDGDGALDYIVSRGAGGSPGQTRAIRTDK